MYVKVGQRVMMIGDDVSPTELTEAIETLTVGDIYTVKSWVFGGGKTLIELEEFPGKRYNLAMFTTVKGV
jgi:hypothetical protein